MDLGYLAITCPRLEYPTVPTLRALAAAGTFAPLEMPIEFGDGMLGTDGYGYFTKVPEPGTFALLGLGLVGLGVSRRRRAAVRGDRPDKKQKGGSAMPDRQGGARSAGAVAWVSACLVMVSLFIAEPAQAAPIDRPLALTIELTMTRYQTCRGPHCYSHSEWDDSDVPKPFIETLLLSSSELGVATFDELADLGLSGPQFRFQWGSSGFELSQSAGDVYCHSSAPDDCSNPFASDGECEGCEDAYFAYLYEDFLANLSYRANLTPGLSWNRWRQEILRAVPVSSSVVWDVERLYWECEIANQRYLCSDDDANGHERYAGGFRLVDIRKVPEPGTFALLGLGLVGVGANRLRSRTAPRR